MNVDDWLPAKFVYQDGVYYAEEQYWPEFASWKDEYREIGITDFLFEIKYLYPRSVVVVEPVDLDTTPLNMAEWPVVRNAVPLDDPDTRIVYKYMIL